MESREKKSPASSLDNNKEPLPKRIQEDVEYLKKWLATQPQLPKITDDKWLAKFLAICKFSLEKTKFKLDGYYSCRSKYPRIMKNRNPFAPEILQSKEAYLACVSSVRSQNWVRLIIFKPEANPEIYVADDFWKRTFMIMDTLYLEEDYRTKFIIIFDFKDLRYTHFLKSVHVIPSAMDIFINAYRKSGLSFNIINAPPYIGTIVDFFKTFMPPKLANRIHVHKETSELLDSIDEDILPEEYGGKGPSLDEYVEFTIGLLEKNAAWFVEQESVCSNETLRRKEKSTFEAMQGSFRKLEVD